MSLYLGENDLKNLVKVKKVNLTNKQIKENFSKIFILNNKLTSFLKSDEYSGFENNIKIGIGSESSGISNGQGTNPLLWEIGHFCYFYEFHCFRHIIDNYSFFISNGDIYDSFKTDRETRYLFKDHSKKDIFEYLNYIHSQITKILSKNLSKFEKYLLTLTILHNHMHCESIIFTKKLLGISNFDYKIYNELDEINFKFIKVNGGVFYQGTYEGENNISFDNELPRFQVKVNSFLVSKYCVTEIMVLDFILNSGYQCKKYWSENGWRYISKNKINCPFYWIKNNNEYFINHNNNLRKIISSFPACHICWYEAEAICNYFGGRLPTESEWEFLATNGGNTKYPWGNKMNQKLNLNYSGDICSVDKFECGDNYIGVRQLIGNVWEWCKEPIYPYNGFIIDPVYREFSYPFFGFKKILKGGSWAVPDILINSRYRNAQMPDCKIQFTGFRIVKDLLVDL